MSPFAEIHEFFQSNKRLVSAQVALKQYKQFICRKLHDINIFVSFLPITNNSKDNRRNYFPGIESVPVTLS
jgi:hypothetical protein